MTDHLAKSDDHEGGEPSVPQDNRVEVTADGRDPVADLADDDGLFPAPVALAPHTGDTGIDRALAELEESASSGSLEGQVAAGEKVHRTLQGRLSDLGGE